MKIYHHQNPVEDAPTPNDIEEYAKDHEPGQFVEWMIERKGKATREYFTERWGIDPEDVDTAIETLEVEGTVKVDER